MKKIVLIFGGIVVVLIAALILVVSLVDVNQYRGVIETRLEQQLGREVTLGEMSLGLLPPRIQISEPVISEDPALGERPPFVSAENLSVRVSLPALIRGNIGIASLELERPSVELVRNSQGVWNFSTIGPGTEAAEPALAAAQATQSSSPEFTLDRLAIRDGQVGVTLMTPSEMRTVYDHIDLTLEDYAPGQSFTFDVAAHLPGEGAQELRVAGEGGPINVGSPLDTPLIGTLELDEVGVEGLRAFLQTDMLSDAGGSLSGESDISNQSGTINAVGNLEFEAARFNGVEVGYPITVAYDGSAILDEKLFTIENATIRLDDTPLSVSGTIDAATSPIRLDLDIESGDVAVDEIARLASAFGIAFPPEARVTGRVSADVEVRGTTDQPVLNGTIAGRDLEISGTNIPQPVEVPVLDLALSPTEIRSNEFEAHSGETTATGRFALSDYTSATPRIDAELRAPNATLPEIQSIARAYGVTGLDRIEGEGGLNLALSASGPLESIGKEALIRALDGDINLDFSPLQASGFDAASELGMIAGFTGGSGNSGLTEILRLTGQIAVANGIASTDDLMAELAVGNLSAAGTADLVAETLDLKAVAVLSQAFSDQIGGTSVGGYLTTALSNAAGEIVIPLTVTGSFSEPRFAPDGRMFAQMQAERLLPSLDDPGSALSGLLDAFAGAGAPAEESGTDAEESSRPEDAIRNILGGFLGGGRSEEPQ